VGEEAATVVEEVDHGVGFVEDDDACRAQAEAAGADEAAEIQRRVQLVRGEHARAQPAGDHGLGPAPLPHPAAEVLDDLAAREAQRAFVAAGAIDVSAQAIELGSKAARVAGVARLRGRAHRTEPLHAAVDDVSHAGQGFHIVDHGGLAEKPLHSREGRLDPRPGPLPLEALDQPGLLAAHVGGGPAVDIDIEREIVAEDALAQESGGRALVDRALHAAQAQGVLVAQVDVRRAGPRGIAAQEDALQDLVRIELHEHAVGEGARLALVGVDAHVDGSGMVGRQERPLQPGEEPGPAPPAQAARPHHGRHLGRRVLLEHAAQGAIAAAGLIDRQGVAVGLVDVGQENGLVVGHGREGPGIGGQSLTMRLLRMLRWSATGNRSRFAEKVSGTFCSLRSSAGRTGPPAPVARARGSRITPEPVQRFHKLVDRLLGQVLVQHVARQHGRGDVAGAQAFGILEAHAAVGRRLARPDAQAPAKVVQQVLAAAGGTTDRAADPDTDAPLRPILLEKAVKRQSILHLRWGQSQQLGDLDHGLRRHVAQLFVHHVQRRQHHRPPIRIPREVRPDGAN